ncbi:hypothetical protein ACXKGW_28820, partial [Klebsiella pneumoniae subsp. pneumoniae]
ARSARSPSTASSCALDHARRGRRRNAYGDLEARLSDGTRVEYDQLIVSPGIQLDWDRIPGLTAALDTPAVSSHYRFDLAKKTSRLLRDVTSGTVVFVQPDGPASCAGAGQKPMYQACDTGAPRCARRHPRGPRRVDALGLPRPSTPSSERKIAEYGIELRTRPRSPRSTAKRIR